MFIPKEIKRILFTEEQISRLADALGERLTRDYAGKNPLFVCVLKGACVFFSDLIRRVECPLEIAFLSAGSYRGTQSTGEVEMNFAELPNIAERHIVLVEDIVDTARTLSLVKAQLLARNPASLKVCCLLDKPLRRVVSGFTADYTGTEIEDLFVVGYGLDYNQKFRNLPYIGIYDEG